MTLSEAINQAEREALERLIAHAKRDTGQSRRVADFLLSWWNCGRCGGFDLTNLGTSTPLFPMIWLSCLV